MKNEIVLDTKPALMVLAEIFRVSSNSDRITKKYGEGKCRLLWEFLKNKEISTIPQVFSEVYSFVKNIDENLTKIFLRNLKQTFKEGIREIYIGKDEIIVDKKFEDLGFTDIGLVEASKNKCLLTSDENLYLYARNRGINAKHSDEIFFKPGK